MSSARVGNAATSQHQHGVYGDLFEVAWRFVEAGHILDDRTAEVLMRLGALAADCTARAVARGVLAARSLGTVPSWRERAHGGNG